MTTQQTILRALFMSIITLAISFPASAATIFVDPTANGNGSGEDWDNATTDLQAALDAVVDPAVDVIWVAAATYVPSVKTITTDERSKTFLISDDPDLNGIKIYGGFLGLAHPSGGETSLSRRDPENNITILSGDLDNDDGPDPFDDNDDNAYHVITFQDIGSSTLLDGFTISGGNADAGFGGGVECTQASPRIVRCMFRWNQSAQGGGLSAHQASLVEIVNCSFVANRSAAFGGGAAATFASHLTLVNCTFVGNVAESQGGGVKIVESASVDAINCTFADNISNATSDGGGGIHFDSYNFGGGIEIESFVINCILVANSPNQIEMVEPSGLPPFSTATVSYSNIEGGFESPIIDGDHNIDEEPAFARNPDPGPDDEWGTSDDDYGDLHLTTSSGDSINGGSNDDLPADFGDLNTNSDFTERLPRDLDVFRKRVLDNVVDMGAFEFGCNADLDATCEIDDDDLDKLLGEWTGDQTYGSFPPYRQTDLNEDGKINGLDLGILLANWGACPDCETEEQLGGGSSESYSSESSLLAQFWQWWLDSDWDAFLEWAAAHK